MQSKGTKSESEIKKPEINKDIVTIGSKTFQINREMLWLSMHDLTAEYAEIEEYNMAKKKDPTKTMQMSAKIDAWALRVLKECLIDFDISALKQKGADIASINKIAVNVFWAVRNGISFLDLVSLTSSSTVQAKD